MLTPTPTTKVNAAKQIVIQGSSNAYTIIYTVPAGRKFIGRAVGSEIDVMCLINGKSIGFCYSGGGTSNSQAANAMPGALTLLAGTTVAFSTSNDGTLIGVEYDA